MHSNTRASILARAQPIAFLWTKAGLNHSQAILDLVHILNIQGKELHLRPDTYEPICVKLGVKQDTTIDSTV